MIPLSIGLSHAYAASSPWTPSIFQKALLKHFAPTVSTSGSIIEGCAKRPGDTWINNRIKSLYGQLFERGFVHTIEVYQDNQLVGGLYGVSIGAAFFGESMFHHVTDASKVALVHLAARLIHGQYELLDTQFLTPHLATLGGIEIPRDDYQTRLVNAVLGRGDFMALDPQDHANGAAIVGLVTNQKKLSV